MCARSGDWTKTIIIMLLYISYAKKCMHKLTGSWNWILVTLQYKTNCSPKKKRCKHIVIKWLYINVQTFENKLIYDAFHANFIRSFLFYISPSRSALFLKRRAVLCNSFAVRSSWSTILRWKSSSCMSPLSFSGTYEQAGKTKGPIRRNKIR